MATKGSGSGLDDNDNGNVANDTGIDLNPTPVKKGRGRPPKPKGKGPGQGQPPARKVKGRRHDDDAEENGVVEVDEGGDSQPKGKGKNGSGLDDSTELFTPIKKKSRGRPPKQPEGKGLGKNQPVSKMVKGQDDTETQEDEENGEVEADETEMDDTVEKERPQKKGGAEVDLTPAVGIGKGGRGRPAKRKGGVSPKSLVVGKKKVKHQSKVFKMSKTKVANASAVEPTPPSERSVEFGRQSRTKKSLNERSLEQDVLDAMEVDDDDEDDDVQIVDGRAKVKKEQAENPVPEGKKKRGRPRKNDASIGASTSNAKGKVSGQVAKKRPRTDSPSEDEDNRKKIKAEGSSALLDKSPRLVIKDAKTLGLIPTRQKKAVDVKKDSDIEDSEMISNLGSVSKNHGGKRRRVSSSSSATSASTATSTETGYHAVKGPLATNMKLKGPVEKTRHASSSSAQSDSQDVKSTLSNGGAKKRKSTPPKKFVNEDDDGEDDETEEDPVIRKRRGRPPKDQLLEPVVKQKKEAVKKVKKVDAKTKTDVVKGIGRGLDAGRDDSADDDAEVKSDFLLEVCVDNIASIVMAVEGGAGRIELCSALSEGGLTPSIGFLRKAKEAAGQAPIFAMIRPRAGDFVYSDWEIDIMADDISNLKRKGVSGFVFGCLTENGRIDKVACRRLLAAASPLPSTFHRAIDVVEDPLKVMGDIVDLGFARILTSGGKGSAQEGIGCIKELVDTYGDKIVIMAGAGLSAGNVEGILKKTGVKEVHGSCRVKVQSKMVSSHDADKKVKMGSSKEDDDSAHFQTSCDIVKQIVEKIRSVEKETGEDVDNSKNEKADDSNCVDNGETKDELGNMQIEQREETDDDVEVVKEKDEQVDISTNATNSLSVENGNAVDNLVAIKDTKEAVTSSEDEDEVSSVEMIEESRMSIHEAVTEEETEAAVPSDNRSRVNADLSEGEGESAGVSCVVELLVTGTASVVENGQTTFGC